MRFLVTGAAGFVGRHVANALVEQGHDVIGIDILATAPAFLPSGIRYERADIREVGALRPLLHGVDSVIHTASLVRTTRRGIDEVWSVNVDGTRALLDASTEAGVTRFVYVSSASVVYDGSDVENGDESLPYTSVSTAPYADSKIAAERLVLGANGKGGLYACSIRPHVIFGPGDQRFLPAILDRAARGRLRVGVGRSPKLSDFTYISNLVDAIVLAHDRLPDVGGQAYFVTNGEPMPFWDFVNRLLDEAGYPRVKYFAPFHLAYAVASIAQGFSALIGRSERHENGLNRFAIRYLCTHHYFDIRKARRELGYDPRVTVVEGIRRTVAYLRSEGRLPRRDETAKNSRAETSISAG